MTIVVARSPEEIDRERKRRARKPIHQAEFLRGWWHGARGVPANYGHPHYALGHDAGRAWRAHHGPEREPNTTHALDAMHRETAP